MNKLVSVIIPCYNQGVYLKEAIRSVLSQTYSFFEIIVVDDGSSENIEKIIEYEPKIKFIKQKNQGVSVARNNGLYNGSGHYIVFLDADDRLLPNALEIGVRFLEQNAECAYVSGHVRFIANNGDYIETPSQPTIEKNHYEQLLQTNYIWTPGAVMYRKSILNNQTVFNREAERCEDLELNLRIARTSTIACHGYTILDYRQHNGNISNNIVYMLKSELKVRKAEYAYIKHDERLLSHWRKGIQNTKKHAGRRLISEIEKNLKEPMLRKQAFKDLGNLIKYCPEGFLRFLRHKLTRS